MTNLDDYILILVLIVFNVATLRILMVTLSSVDFKQAVTEKHPDAVKTPGAQAGAAGGGQAAEDAGAPGGGAGAQAQPSPGKAPENIASYSRISGVVGVTVLATFLWALGNVVLYKSLYAPTEVDSILKGATNFFLAGSALFAPYAFNQLRSIFNVKGS